jgi:hypothetical protein
MRGTPAIADVDRDGTIEIVAAGYDQTVYVWDFSAPYNGALAPWPMKHCNWHRNGTYGVLVPTAVGDADAPVSHAAMEQNYPNPFNPTTTIVFYVPERAGAVPVQLSIYDVTGARVRTLVDGDLTPGRYSFEWDGVNDSGNQVGSGVYFYRVVQPGFSATRKMVLLK